MTLIQNSNKSKNIAQNMTFSGSYGKNYAQNGVGGSFVGGDGSIALYGNVRKAYKLEIPYAVNGDTHISFDFELFEEAEGHAICADEDTDDDTFGGAYRRCIALAGTEYESWNELHVKKIEKAEVDGTMSLTVKIGNLFPEIGLKIKYIAFVQDNDKLPFNGASRFRNIRLFNSPPVSV